MGNTDTDHELKPPVLCIGATRSGTSMLVRMLGGLPGCCCWYEPNALWRTGHARRDHDAADERDAGPWVRRWIRKRFAAYQRDAGGARVIEKSPYNVLKIPFVHAVFPEARLVHIYRDGRANLRSQVEMSDTYKAWGDQTPRGHLRRRLAELPPWEWPSYLPRTAGSLIRSRLLGKPVSWFGLRYPGWREDRRTLSAPEIAAKQWVAAVETALRDLERIDPAVWIHVRYEDLVAEPRPQFERIIEHCGLQADDAFWERVDERVHGRSVHRWEQELDPDALERAMPTLRPTLCRLGYLQEG